MTSPGDLLWGQRAHTRVLVYLNGVETDITQYVLVPAGGITASRGRQTELSTMDPSRLSLTLDNRDGRFTPGNTSSSLYPYWRQSVRLVWTETIGARTFTHFDGYIEVPEVQLNYETRDGNNDRTLSLSAVDQLTRVSRMRPFISTLGAHIVGSSDTLVAYWPFTDATGRKFASAAGTSGKVIAQMGAVVTPHGQAGPAGDDESYMTVSGVPASVSLVPAVGYFGLLSGVMAGVSAGSTDTIAISVWVRLTSDGTTQGIANAVMGPIHQAFMILYGGTTLSAKYVNAGGGATSATAEVGLPADSWQLATARFSLATGELTLWLGKSVVATQTVGSPPASFTPVKMSIGDAGNASGSGGLGFYGSLAHLQVYVGAAASTMPYEAHLEQLDVGLRGLARQSTGARIRTIAGYAGFSGAQLDHIDDGTTLMQAASLAGQTPLAAWQQAADAERGRLFSGGDGSVVFHDRRRIYNT